MLTPYDYDQKSIFDPVTRKIMDKITFSHGGQEYDKKYPEGIPTSIQVKTKEGKEFDSGLVMFPGGHAKNETVLLREILSHKFKTLGLMAMDKGELKQLIVKLENIGSMDNAELQDLYDCKVKFAEESIDGVGD